MKYKSNKYDAMHKYYIVLEKLKEKFHIYVVGDAESYIQQASRCGYELVSVELKERNVQYA